MITIESRTALDEVTTDINEVIEELVIVVRVRSILITVAEVPRFVSEELVNRQNGIKNIAVV
ncbi:hypothetical protein D3C86_1917380 [compost metagenome]